MGRNELSWPLRLYWIFLIAVAGNVFALVAKLMPAWTAFALLALAGVALTIDAARRRKREQIVISALLALTMTWIGWFLFPL